jgi:EF hand domain-containing protein
MEGRRPKTEDRRPFVTINNTYTQSIAFSFTAYSTSRVSATTIGAGTQTPAPPASATESPVSAPVSATPASAPVSETPSAVDRVQLSSDATTQTAAPGGSGTPQRGDALFGALDADKDGSITEQEFTDGAMALLRRAGARHHHHVHHDGSEKHDREVRGSGRLGRKLEKLFDRVDANHDGSIDTGELTKALARSASADGSEPSSSTPTGSTPQTVPATTDPASVSAAPVAPDTRASVAPAGDEAWTSLTSVSVTRVTYIAVAVQQYTAIGAMG